MLQSPKSLISILKRIWSKIIKIWRGFNAKQKLISIAVMFFVILPMFIILPLSKLLLNNNSSSSNNYSSQDYQYKSFEELKTECEAANNKWWPDTSECITIEEANTRTAEINHKLADEEAKKKQEEDAKLAEQQRINNIYDNPLNHNGESISVTGTITSITSATQDNTSIGMGFKKYTTMIPCNERFSSAEFWIKTANGKTVNVFAESCDIDKDYSVDDVITISGKIVNDSSTLNQYLYILGTIK